MHSDSYVKIRTLIVAPSYLPGDHDLNKPAWIYTTCTWIFIISPPPSKENVVFYFYKLESSFPKDALDQFWLIPTELFWRRSRKCKKKIRQTDAEQKVIGKAQLTFQSGELRKKVPDLYHLLKYMYYVSFLFWMVENNFTTRPCKCFDPRIVFSQWEKLSYMRRENPNFKTWRIRRRVVC